MGSKKRKRSSPRQAPREIESPAAEWLTVAWTNSALVLLVCNVAAAVTRLYAAARPEEARIGLLAGLLFFSAATIGVVSLMLLVLVLKTRRQSPPHGFTLFALIMAVAPLVAAVIEATR